LKNFHSSFSIYNPRLEEEYRESTSQMKASLTKVNDNQLQRLEREHGEEIKRIKLESRNELERVKTDYKNR